MYIISDSDGKGNVKYWQGEKWGGRRGAKQFANMDKAWKEVDAKIDVENVNDMISILPLQGEEKLA